jgi:hypothetical protein
LAGESQPQQEHIPTTTTTAPHTTNTNKNNTINTHTQHHNPQHQQHIPPTSTTPTTTPSTTYHIHLLPLPFHPHCPFASPLLAPLSQPCLLTYVQHDRYPRTYAHLPRLAPRLPTLRPVCDWFASWMTVLGRATVWLRVWGRGVVGMPHSRIAAARASQPKSHASQHPDESHSYMRLFAGATGCRCEDLRNRPASHTPRKQEGILASTLYVVAYVRR